MGDFEDRKTAEDFVNWFMNDDAEMTDELMTDAVELMLKNHRRLCEGVSV